MNPENQIICARCGNIKASHTFRKSKNRINMGGNSCKKFVPQKPNILLEVEEIIKQEFGKDLTKEN